MTTVAEWEELFSYGTLQIESVQLVTFGRKLAGAPDSLPGYRQTRIAINDPQIIATSGASYYLNAEHTGRAADVVAGMRFQVTQLELAQADSYEAEANYKRIRVQMASGMQAWVYVSAA
jgi:hypothetical protein